MDYLIIGAGPAGLQLGKHLKDKGRDVVILEAGERVGTFFETFPRHRTLISVNKVYTGTSDPELNMRMDWNSLLTDDKALLFGKYTDKYFPPAGEFLRYLHDFAEAYALPIKYNARVARISRPGGGAFRVETAAGDVHEAKRVIVATGVSLPNIPDIPGIETAEQYADVSVDPRDFINQRVLIIGKGNSAFETADNLIPTADTIHVAGPRSLQLAWRTHYVGHLRAVNNNFLDTYQLKSQNALIDGHIDRIVKDEQGYLVTVRFVRANEVKKDLRYDRVISCTGFRFDASIFADECRPTLTIGGRFPLQNGSWEAVGVPDLYFAGTLMQATTYKKSTTAFIHGFRYSVRCLHRILEERYEQSSWPSTRLTRGADALMEATLRRVNRSSALWQQFACLGDVLVEEPTACRYFEELPMDYIRESAFGEQSSYFVVTLEYGPGHDLIDPFDVASKRIAQDDAMRADEGHYLHPVVRHYHHGELVATHHVTENLENDWTSEVTHRRPLAAFYTRELARTLPNAAAAPDAKGEPHAMPRRAGEREAGMFA